MQFTQQRLSALIYWWQNALAACPGLATRPSTSVIAAAWTAVLLVGLPPTPCAAQQEVTSDDAPQDEGAPVDGALQEPSPQPADTAAEPQPPTAPQAAVAAAPTPEPPAAAAAPAPGPQPARYYQPNGTRDDRINKCNNIYFPVAEISALDELPVEILFVRRFDEDRWIPTAAAGLNLVGVHLNIARPSCFQSPTNPWETIAPINGGWLTLMLSLNTSFSVLENMSDRTVMVENPDTMMTTMTEVEVNEAQAGALLTAAAALLFRIRWEAGGHGNFFAIGFFARFGVFIGEGEQDQIVGVAALGPGIVFGIR